MQNMSDGMLINKMMISAIYYTNPCTLFLNIPNDAILAQQQPSNGTGSGMATSANVLRSHRMTYNMPTSNMKKNRKQIRVNLPLKHVPTPQAKYMNVSPINTV